MPRDSSGWGAQAITPAMELSFGARFVAEIERLGVALPSPQRERLRRGSRGQIICAVEKRLPGIRPEILRSLAHRGPEALARELALVNSPREGVTSVLDAAFDTVCTLDAVESVFSGLDLW